MTTFEQQLQDSLSHAYDIERELGGGGMSRVFVATERSLGRKVVIKLLSPELTAEVNRGRFRREIQVAAQLQHPHIVTLLSAGEYGDLVYYTMPFIRGESLKSAVEKDGAMRIEDVVRVLYDVVDALAYAHENGVVHRDIKPANILRSGAHSLVTDFGVAKALNAAMSGGGMTSTGMAIGTPAYMSPEQLAGDPAADHRIDIYALGLLAYELLTGQSPFAASTARGVLAAVLTREPQPLVEVRTDVPRALSTMVMACLTKEPEGRPENAAMLLSALDMFSTSSGEIRTREYRVPKSRPATPPGPMTYPSTLVTNPAFASNSAVSSSFAGGSSAPSGSSGLSGSFGASGTSPVTDSAAVPRMVSAGTILIPATPIEPNVAADVVPTYEHGRRRKKRNKLLIGGIALLVPVAAGAIYLTQHSDEKRSTSVTPALIAPVADSTQPQQAAAQTAPLPQAALQSAPVAAVPESAVAIKKTVDPKSNADSVRARAARAEATKKLAAAKGDSIKNESEQKNRIEMARRGAAAMLSSAEASKAFQRGASRTGGLLGIQKKGDLQTQIDALRPFLTSVGLTYDQFKAIVKEAGFNIFDEFGRMVPEALQRFAASTS